MELAKNKTIRILYSAKLKDQIPRLKDQIHEQTVQQDVIHEQTEGLDSLTNSTIGVYLRQIETMYCTLSNTNFR